jgi:hypothetical protein
MKLFAGLALSLIALSTPSAIAQGDPFVGTWVLNVAKSKYTPGPPPRSQTTVYAAAGRGYKVTTKGVAADGSPTLVEFTVNDEGQDVRVTGSPDYESTSLKRIDTHQMEFTRKKGGKVVQTATASVSKDGKTRTITTTGTNAKGQKIHNVAVFEKQGRTTS